MNHPHNFFQSYLTAPEDFPGESIDGGGSVGLTEDSFSLPAFRDLDPKLISNAPSNLLRSSHGKLRPAPPPPVSGSQQPQYAWGPDDDSGQMPSDIQVVREEHDSSAATGATVRGQPPGVPPPHGGPDYERMFSENRPSIFDLVLNDGRGGLPPHGYSLSEYLPHFDGRRYPPPQVPPRPSEMHHSVSHPPDVLTSGML